MKLLSTFLFIVFLLTITILFIAAFHHRHRGDDDIDSQYWDENGDHIYYDRSLIEKKNYLRHFPHSLSELRKFSHLFKR